MGALIRLLLGVLGLLVVVVVGAMLYLTLVLDPNDFRDDIERLAAEQGVPLQIGGDIRWQWFPVFGLSVEGVKVEAGKEPLLDAQRLAASVALVPLLQKQVSIEAIELVGVQINAWTDAQGRGNWELLSQQQVNSGSASSAAPDSQSTGSTISSTSAASDTASPVDLSVATLRVTDGQLSYRDEASGSRVQVSDLDLTVGGFDLSGALFELKQSATLHLDGQPPLQVRSHGQLGFNLAQQQLQLKGMGLSLVANQLPLTLQLDGNVALEPLTAQLDVALEPVHLGQWLTQFGVALPEMSAADALARVSLESQVSGQAGAWNLNNLIVKLDQTSFTGHAGVDAQGRLSVALNGDRLNLDRYLPVPAADVAQAKAAQTSSPSTNTAQTNTAQARTTKPSAESENALLMSDEPLQLSALRDLSAQLSFNLDHMIAKELQFSELVFKVDAHDGVLKLQKLAGQVVDGQFDLQGQLDARQAAAQLNLNGDLKGLELKPLLATLAEEERLVGKASGDLTLNTTGNSLRQLQNRMDAKLQLQADTLVFNSIDIERNACELAALVNREAVPQLTWKGHTELQAVTAALALKGTELKIQSLRAGVENLALKADGKLDYLSGKFDVPLSIAFTGEADRSRKCQIRDRWRNRDLPLRCKGNLEDVSAKSCGIDSKRINKLLEDEAKDQLKDKLQDKLLEKLGGDSDDKNDAVKGLLNNLFKKD